MDLDGKETYLSIHRKNLTISTDVKNDILVNELKRIIGSIIKQLPKDLQLHYEDEIMDGTKPLSYYDLSDDIQNPMLIGLSLKMPNGEFEPLEITPYSSPSSDFDDLIFSEDEETFEIN
ncbi:elongin-B-like isoform X2 [Rhopalosiphum padi]|uniref:elongin-B-like isoform X2 n=1 Tax=Rhopalosiphum padi TaxID=40932 RepID=UPI00298DE659|nr:elongin-B-like isoform X2 [Rhopalosiphum padi]